MKNFSVLLARVMVLGTLFSAAIIAFGLVWYLFAHPGQPVGDHIFSGEPKFLTNPGDMLLRAASPDAFGERRSIIMLGLFLLLLNPPLRVLLAALGYACQHDRLYTTISAIVLAVLLLSFF